MKKILLIVAIALTTSTGNAQSGTSVRGHVTDAHNANVAGAEVVLIPRSGTRMKLMTDGNGAYVFNNLSAGDYMIEARAKGFATFTSTVFKVSRGQTQTTDINLGVEGLTESVAITATGTAQRIDEPSKAVSVLDDQTIESKRD